jgi:hypothetical protein
VAFKSFQAFISLSQLTLLLRISTLTSFIQFHPVSSSTGPTGKRPSRNGLLTTLKVSVKADNSNSSSPVACGVASTGLEIPSKDEAKDEPAKWTMKVKVC